MTTKSSAKIAWFKNSICRSKLASPTAHVQQLTSGSGEAAMAGSTQELSRETLERLAMARTARQEQDRRREEDDRRRQEEEEEARLREEESLSSVSSRESSPRNMP